MALSWRKKTKNSKLTLTMLNDLTIIVHDAKNSILCTAQLTGLSTDDPQTTCTYRMYCAVETDIAGKAKRTPSMNQCTLTHASGLLYCCTLLRTVQIQPLLLPTAVIVIFSITRSALHLLHINASIILLQCHFSKGMKDNSSSSSITSYTIISKHYHQ